jgi:hypothetical protein
MDGVVSDKLWGANIQAMIQRSPMGKPDRKVDTRKCERLTIQGADFGRLLFYSSILVNTVLTSSHKVHGQQNSRPDRDGYFVVRSAERRNMLGACSVRNRNPIELDYEPAK